MATVVILGAFLIYFALFTSPEIRRIADTLERIEHILRYPAKKPY